MSAGGYPVLAATLPSAHRPPEHDAEPWEGNVHATCECLSWRGALDNLERRHAEDALGESTYAEFPLHARSAVVTAHLLMEKGTITEPELEFKMREIRARFRRGVAG